MNNKIIIYNILLLCTLLYSDFISAQNKYSGIRKNRDYYQFHKLPMIPSLKMAPNSVIKQDFFLTLRDNVQMDCSRFYPDVSNPYLPNGYPTVIMVHGYGDRKETLEGFAGAQASYGYVVYTYSVRGQGNSGGLSNLISTTEAQDLIEFVNYIRQDFQTGLDTSNILIMGGSQGGTVPYIAACSGGLKVKTIISALTSPEFASSWIENGSIKMTFLWTIEYPSDTARYSSQVMAMRDWVFSGAADKWDSLAYWLPKDRNFTNTVSQNNIPIMMENAWQDKFFNAKGNLNYSPFVNSPKRYYFGAVRGHGGDFSTTEDTWHENFFNEWYYYWLWNIENGILTRPKYHYAFTTYPEINGMWTFVHDSSSVWPPPGADNLILYFRNNSRLLATPGTGQTNNLVNSVRAGFTMQTAVNEEFKGTAFTNNFKKASLTYNSAVLTQDVQMIGTPQVRLDYSSTATECQFNYQIYEVSGTRSKLITRINYTDRKNTPNLRKNVIVDGLSHGHIFRAGNIIRIIVTNLDTAPDDSLFLGSNPHVLPDLKNGISKIYYSNNSFINIPIIGVGSRPGMMSRNKEKQNNSSNLSGKDLLPTEFKLSQNYPNPFNPSTTIEYSVPVNSYVTLKVYDISGKEVAVLVNDTKSPGFYSVKLNSVNYGLSSGIYFYKLIAGNFISIKKLVLIK